MSRKREIKLFDPAPTYEQGRFERGISYPGNIHLLSAKWWVGYEVTTETKTGKIVSKYEVTFEVDVQGGSADACADFVKTQFDKARANNWGYSVPQ